MSERLRVAVAGARGIGKHHAKWFVRAGCDLTALYGTRPDTAREAADFVREMVPFTGRVFSNWEQFIAEGDFEAVSVCSPADAHHQNVLSLARAGKHVLCEKPLCWRWEATPAAIIQEAREIMAAMQEADRILAVNAQYPAALEPFRQLHRELLGLEADFPRLSYFMETRGPPRSPQGPAEVWVDLAPHPLAFLDAAAPGTVRWSSLRHAGQDLETRVSFDWLSDERVIPVEMTLRRVPGGDPVRRFSNGRIECDYEGRNVDGEFVTVLRAEGREWVGPDFMRISVERFVDAVRQQDPGRVLVSGAAGLRQLEVLAGVWARCWWEKGNRDGPLP
jgi:predicted dehydrogenase